MSGLADQIDPEHPRLHGRRALARVVDRNVRALLARRADEERTKARSARIADRITRFTGSMRFVYLHAFIYGFWIIANLGWVPGVTPWDPTYVVLAMMASVEAIFLSTFILISQNRMAAASDRRAELDLQVSLLSEHEITRLVEMVAAIADRLEVPRSGEVEELKRNVAPEAVLDVIEAEERK